MARWWHGLALVGLGWLGANARAQYPPPGVGGPPMPPSGMGGPPMPPPGFATDGKTPPPPEFCPGSPPPPIPISPFDPPHGPAPNAFDDPYVEEGVGFYANATGLGLQRASLNKATLVVQDPVGNPDSGIPPAIPPIILLSAQDVSVPFNMGLGGAVGLRNGPDAIEVSGFHLFQDSRFSQISKAGLLDLPFGNVGSPPNFAGNNNLWLQADQVRVGLRTGLYTVDANFRRTLFPALELLFGFRYCQASELFNIITDDDGLTLGAINPAAFANYSIRTVNNLAGPQIGFGGQYAFFPAFTVSHEFKVMIGVNFEETTGRLERGDGLLAPVERRYNNQAATLVDYSVYANLNIGEHLRFKGGYQLLWLGNVAPASSQINSAINTTLISNFAHGDILYHGPVLQFELHF